MLGGEFGRQCFDGALGVHYFGGGDAGQFELHGKRFGKQARVTRRDAGAAALAHADFDNAESGEGTQRVARHDAADAVARRKIFFGADEVAGLEPLLVKVVAHLHDNLRR